MINFLEETLDMLKDCGKTEDDVLWVGRCEDWASGYPDEYAVIEAFDEGFYPMPEMK